MRLSAGEKLGPYEIVAPIGAGGMGEVYRARDARLGRDVALKVSAERFTERFEREARAVAALNHPCICTLHDVGPDYLVMELVEGQTLAERIKEGPIPLGEALAIARQIADALEAAHDKGIVHRDLKPGNIILKGARRAGDAAVKVLDFGLAKQSHDLDGMTADNSPTFSIAATGAGMIVGTAAYMAPEQARGKSVDKRADIWAFGVVLYEMVTGRKAFDGEDASTIMAAVIQSEPRWDGIPRQLRRLLSSCLEKDPGKRLRDIGDAWKLLDDPEATVPSRSWTGHAGWIAAGALAIAAGLVVWAPWRPTAPVDRSLVRFDVDLGGAVSLPPLAIPTPSTLSMSADGRRIVYIASVSGGPPQLFVKNLDEAGATALPGTEDARNPFFSPDGQWVGFLGRTKIQKVSVDSGAVVALSDVATMAGASWGSDGNIIVGSGFTQGLIRIDSSGGAPPQAVTKLADGELFHSFPQVLPGSQAALMVVYATTPTLDTATIEVVSLADGLRKVLVRGGTSARYVPSGHLIYTNREKMFAVPFDLDKLETYGTPVVVLNDLAYDASAGFAQFGLSTNGMLVYRNAGRDSSGATTIQWLDSAGKTAPLRGQAGRYSSARLSPDGKRLAMEVSEGPTSGVWVYDLQRDAAIRLTFGGGIFASPIWSPDGKYVVFAAIGNGLQWARADGGGQPRSLNANKSIQFPTSFSADGRRVALYQVGVTPQIWTLPIEDGASGLAGGKQEQFLSTTSSDFMPMFSPDGRWMAYQSDESGVGEVYVRALSASSSGQAGKWLVSNKGGAFPAWSRNSRELFYQAGDQIMVSRYSITGDTFVPDRPRVWASKLEGATLSDVAPDGKRVVLRAPVSGLDAARSNHHVVFVQNFFDELRRRVPTGR